MPYRWTSPDNDTQTLTLWPWRSLPLRGFAVIIMMTFLFITVPLYGLLGTVFFWGLLPFALLALAGLWWALRHTYNTADIRETLTLTPQEILLIHQPRKGDLLEWRCNTYWASVHIYPGDGPVPHYVTLRGNGREVEIGSFLSEDERKSLYRSLDQALLKAKT